MSRSESSCHVFKVDPGCFYSILLEGVLVGLGNTVNSEYFPLGNCQEIYSILQLVLALDWYNLHFHVSLEEIHEIHVLFNLLVFVALFVDRVDVRCQVHLVFLIFGCQVPVFDQHAEVAADYVKEGV